MNPHRREVLEIARRYGVRRLRIFGSIRRHEGRPDSDLDLLVEWGPDRKPLAWLQMPIELRKVLGRNVDLVALDAVHWAIRPQVDAEAVPV